MNIENLVEKYDSLATQLAPEVLEKVVQTTQIGGLGNIITGFVFFGIWAILMYIAYKLNPEFDDMNGWIVPQVVAMVIGSLVFFMPACFMILDMWNWVAIWRPDLAITHQVINSLAK